MPLMTPAEIEERLKEKNADRRRIGLTAFGFAFLAGLCWLGYTALKG